MQLTIVTNNPKCHRQYSPRYEVLFDPTWDYGDVLKRSRDLVHQGQLLLTHPMAGSLKPNQTPYRSIVLSDTTLEDKEPYQDVLLMENSMAAYEKFLQCRKLPNWTESIREDFQTLDLSHIEGALNNSINTRQ